jgi:hypothetical protein
MDPHKYRVGQTVRFNKNNGGIALGVAPTGYFRVIGLLPDTQGRNQYRVESTSDGHQRVAVESEIAVR